MSLVEGGPFRCDAKHFVTEEVEEWNKHCMEDCDLHFEHGTTSCIACGVRISYSGLPYQPYNKATGSKGIALKCNECESKAKGSVQISTIST